MKRGALTICSLVILAAPALISANLLCLTQRMPAPESTQWRIEMTPAIMAGESGGSLRDSPGRREDSNTTTSLYAGVGSLELTFQDGLGICSGTAITPRHVLTAAHCVTYLGSALEPESVTFVLNAGADQSHRITASAIAVKPGYLPNGAARHDLAVVTLEDEIPEGIPVYDILRDPLPLRTVVTMVGYGLSGDGHSGIDYQLWSFSVKRVGQNVIDFIGLPGGSIENVFFYDFDGPQADGLNILGGFSLGNRIETCVALGDSGGPAFVPKGGGSLLVAAVNNFVVHFRSNANRSPFTWSPRFSTFGEGGGGLIVPPNAAWIDSVTGAVAPLAQPVLDVDESDASTALIKELAGNYEIYVIAPRVKRGL